MKARNSEGLSPQSDYVNVETSVAHAIGRIAPARPASLAASTVRENSVTLKWDDPGDSSITHYQVLRRGGDSGSFTIFEENSGSADTTYTDTTVSADTGYQYRVMAVSDGGKSPESDNLSVRTLSGETSLTASLTGVTVRDITQSTATVDVSVDNADNTKVFLRYRPADDPRRTRILSATLKSSSVLLFYLGHLYPSRSQPLLPASDYIVEVSLDGDFSTGVVKTSLRTDSPPNTPGAPTITSVLSENHSLVVAWSGPLDNGGTPITGYRVQWRLDHQMHMQRRSAVTTGDGNLTIGSLDNRVPYMVRVVARNENGEGLVSEEVTAIPGIIGLGISVWDITQTTAIARVRLSSTVNGTVYLRYRPSQQLAWTQVLSQTTSSDSVPFSFSGLTAGMDYDVQASLTSDFSDLEAIWFRTAPVALTPGPPTNLTVKGRRHEIVVNWEAPASDGGSRISEYLVQWESEIAAGQQTDLSPVESGYSTYGDLGGSLTPDRFLLEGTTYRVKFLAHSRESLWLGLDRELPADFTLLVTDSHYRGSESMVPPSIDGVAAYWWPSTPPDWLGDDPVRVGLTVHPEVPLGDRQKAPVTGYFHSFPPEHDGIEDVSFRIFFSEVVSTTAGALRDHVLSVSGGTVSSVEAVGDEGMVWAVLVTPESTDAVTIEIEAGPDCALPGAICTADGRRLFNRMELDVAGPPPTAGEPTPQPGPKNNPATGPPTIRGEARVGATLRVSLSALVDADGLSGAVFSYQWIADDADIADATASTYFLDADDEGKTIRVRVSFTDDAGNEEALTSTATKPVAPR